MEEDGRVGEEERESQREAFLRDAESSLLVVDNLPRVGLDKVDKLRGVLLKIFKEIGQLAPVVTSTSADGQAQTPGASDGGVFLPVDAATQQSKGFAIVRYKKPSHAEMALKATNGYQLDKNHQLVTCSLADVRRVQAVTDDFREPDEVARLKQAPATVVDTSAWLMDVRGREQFCIRHGDETEIYWQDSVLRAERDYARTHWTDSKVLWSPRGSYLTTFHAQGIALWGGSAWEKVVRFPHKNVKFALFSPNEKYVITSNALEVERDNPKDPQSIKVWEVATGRCLRGFLGEPAGKKMEWPVFTWNHEDSMFARMGPGVISVYGVETMSLLDKKSIKIPDVQRFTWSPTDNVMAYWTPENSDAPARVTLLELPSKRELRNNALFSVDGIVMNWHPQGDYLCCLVNRMTKSKKGRFPTLELFRMRPKGIPIETMEFKEGESITNFGWEPRGHRFAFMLSDGSPGGRWDVQIHTMQGNPAPGAAASVDMIKPVWTLEQKTISHLFWSPQGSILLLAGLTSTQNGSLEWVHVSDKEIISSGEHFQATDVKWDPSGRFVASSVPFQRSSLESGYMIWNCVGRELHSAGHDVFYEFLWRPTPPSVLVKSQLNEMKKNIKSFRDRYEKEDQELKESRRSGKAATRQREREEWQRILQQAAERFELEREMRMRARGGKFDYDATRIPQDGASLGFRRIETVIEHVVELREEVDMERGKLVNSDDDRD
ncbi:Eukaryotic translation initiation factor 3 subunit B [Porphyridium purpureum]|uniref:Eukaryotic translation initiation factor 3 subunit B n=1 Tax=Porphyridium purpureum TaxID=35688 RepID=A0A5J4YTF7_PORPP|nr:Eukaryotic translation initiation factor 3 subunit B [Porphyridium purpureum]|eukprot:POR9377..scf229_5